MRSETLAGMLGTNSASLKPALDELVASGQVKRAGMARGRTYTAGSSGGGGASQAPGKKMAAKKRSKKAGRLKARTK